MQVLELKELILIFLVGVLNSLAIMWFAREQFKESLLAVFRSLIQLLILGLVLEQIFELGTWPAKIIAVIFIVLVGARTLKQRIESPHTSYLLVSTSMFLSILPAIGVAALVLDYEHFSKPSFFIPYVGMLVGNSLNGLNLGMRNFYKELRADKDKIIYLLSFGANDNEAISEQYHNGLKNGLTPIINVMLIVGLVSIPGLMTGQMMAGANPLLSARYQYFLMITIQSTVLTGILVYFVMVAGQLKKKENFILKLIGEEK
jgi:putative ABC transport system permease protein